MEERLETILRATAGRPTSAIVNAVTNAVRSFANGAPQSDEHNGLGNPPGVQSSRMTLQAAILREYDNRLPSAVRKTKSGRDA